MPFRSNHHFSFLVVIISFMIWKNLVFAVSFLIVQYLQCCSVHKSSLRFQLQYPNRDEPQSWQLTETGCSAGPGTIVFISFIMVFSDSCSDDLTQVTLQNYFLGIPKKCFPLAHEGEKKERKCKINSLSNLHESYFFVSILPSIPSQFEPRLCITECPLTFHMYLS